MRPLMAGPGWGNVNTIDAAWLAKQAKAQGVKCYMRELSVHVRRPAGPEGACVCAGSHVCVRGCVWGSRGGSWICVGGQGAKGPSPHREMSCTSSLTPRGKLVSW